MLVTINLDEDARKASAAVQKTLLLVEQTRVFAYRNYHRGYAVLYIRDQYGDGVIQQRRIAGFKAAGVDLLGYAPKDQSTTSNSRA